MTTTDVGLQAARTTATDYPESAASTPAGRLTLTELPQRDSWQLQQQDRQWQLDYHVQPDGSLMLLDCQGPALSPLQAGQLLDRVLSHTGAEQLIISAGLAQQCPPLAVGERHPEDARRTLSRAAFYQMREYWLPEALWPVAPQAGAVHQPELDYEGIQREVPCRPAVPEGEVYRRYIAELDEVFSLRRATPEMDGERFHQWQNEPRIAEFWEYPFSREWHDQYLRDKREDSHSEPLIACFDGQPFGYIETYWALEDRLGPYYDVHPYDHGFHVLVGDPRYLGKGRTTHWINGVSHYLFLLDPRTQRLVGEPRADNVKLLKWLEHTAWYKEREFDFPHKRAALLKCERDTFFRTTRL